MDEDARDPLGDLIEQFGRANAPEVVARARAEALARATSILAEEMAHSLLDHARPLLAESRGREPAEAPAPQRRDPARARERAAPARQPTPAPGPEPAEGALGVWTYGVVRADEATLAAALSSSEGVAAARPRLLEHAGLGAIISPVPLSEFGEEPLRENLNDVAWLERTARAHEAVLDAAMGEATVVPLRLCTIYRAEDQVGEMLERERAVLEEALDHLDGKTEWGVKLIAEPGALGRALAADDPTADTDLSPGAAYMQGKSRAARAREDAERLADEWAHRAHERLAARAVEARMNPLQNPEVSGYEGEMILNGAYLVDDREHDAFSDEHGRLQAEVAELGVSVELTGPWPPYNFVRGSIEAAR